jgi:predicted PurR-regulated permease PerM
LQGLRRRIAERMEIAWQIPHVTSFDEINASNLVALRQHLQPEAERRGLRLTYLPFIVKAVTQSLKENPYLNASLDMANKTIQLHRHFHIGIATAVPEGLLVPVIHHADQLNLLQITGELTRLGDLAQQRKLELNELSGSTFTITNFGSFGGHQGTPIINPPEVAILGVGRIEDKPMVVDGQIEVRPVLLFLLLWFGAQAFLLVFAGYLVAVFVRAPTRWVARRARLSHRLAFALVLLILTLLAFALGSWAAPRVAEQADELSRQLPQAFRDLTRQLGQYEWSIWLQSRVEGWWESTDGAWMSRALGAFSTFAGAIAGFLIVFFAGLYFAFDPWLYRNGLLALVPLHRRGRVAEVLSETDETLRYWMIGKIVAMAVIGVLTWIGLALLGIPLAFLLALLAALLTFIPNFGPIASTVPPALLALAQSPMKAVWVVLLFIGIQALESNLITPIIQKRAIEMPPALILATQVVFALLFGFLGIAVATPLTAAVIVLVRRLYVEDALGSRT